LSAWGVEKGVPEKVIVPLPLRRSREAGLLVGYPKGLNGEYPASNLNTGSRIFHGCLFYILTNLPPPTRWGENG